MDENHTISIIVVVLKGWQTLERCLRVLLPQAVKANAEIIVVADSRYPEVAQLQKIYPLVTFKLFSEYHTYAELRSEGILCSEGSVVAITEDHCIPEPDWCQQVIQGHTAPYVGVGGPVEKEFPDRLVNWAVYFADYLRYMKPIGAAQAKNLTDLNASYKRVALDKIRQIWEKEFHENLVNEALLLNGGQLWLSPDITVRQQRNFRLGEAIYDRYAFGRLLASTRVKSAAMSRRLVFMLLSILVPFLLLFRTTRQIIQKRRWLGQYVKAFPMLVMLSFAWGFGEMIGYFTGRPEKSLSAG